MLPMATGFIFWIIMQAKNTGGIVIFSQVTACPAILLKISSLIW